MINKYRTREEHALLVVPELICPVTSRISRPCIAGFNLDVFGRGS